jgi:hypothetical protein
MLMGGKKHPKKTKSVSGMSPVCLKTCYTTRTHQFNYAELQIILKMMKYLSIFGSIRCIDRFPTTTAHEKLPKEYMLGILNSFFCLLE